MNTRGTLLLLVGKWCLNHAANAQVNDAGAWMGVGLEKRITQKASVLMEAETRFGENLGVVDNTLVDFSGHYEFSSFFKFSAHYRYSSKRQEESHYLNRHRYNFDATFSTDLKDIKLSYRARYQTQYTGIHTRKEGAVPTIQVRNKVTVSYSFDKPLSPRIWGELFNGLNPESRHARRIRVGAGLKYRLDKHSSLDAAYLVQRDLNEVNPYTDYVLALNYSYTF